jgi:protein ImuB
MKGEGSMLVCLRIPDYALAVALGGKQMSGDVPLLLADRYDRGHVIALDGRAREEGARIGQTVTQATAAVPNARVVVYDRVRAQAVWQELLDALDTVTPLIDDVREGIAYLDMRGIAGDLESWSAQVRTVVERFALTVACGAGPNRFCAYAATWIADGTTIEPGEEAHRVAPLPLLLLELDSRAAQRLHLLGVATLGELARLPHGPFVRRFGREAARWHDWSRGIDRAPFLPRGHALAIEASLFGEGSAESEEAVLFALRVLLARICSDLERTGKRASALQLDIELDNGEVEAVPILLASATAQERAMLDVLRAKLEGLTFAAPLVGLRLRALRLEEGGEAMPLVRNDDIDRENIAVVLARLEAVLGEPVLRARTRAAYPLEERFTYEPWAIPKRESGGATVLASRVVPQLRLLTVTEIEVTIARGEPASVDSHTVLSCAGPWRIEEGWFAAAIARDEYDVALDDGTVCRIYRQGTRWYLRGLYD